MKIKWIHSTIWPDAGASRWFLPKMTERDPKDREAARRQLRIRYTNKLSKDHFNLIVKTLTDIEDET